MDVNHYIRIVKVQAADHSMSRYINGVVFYKNVAHKNMRSRIVGPDILLLEEGTSFTNYDSQLVSMETVLSQESQRQRLFIRKIKELQPSLLFVEKGLSQKTISELSKRGITAVVDVKKTVLAMISRVTGGAILTSIDQAAGMSSCIGHCGEFAVKQEARGTLVYITQEAGKGVLGASIVLSGPDLNQLRTIKTVLKTLITDYRSALLQADFWELIGITPCEICPTSAISLKLLTINTKLCVKPQSLRFPLYQDPEDLPLGRKLLHLRRDLANVCACGCAMHSHALFYCREGGVVRVTGHYEAGETLPMHPGDSVFLTLICRNCAEVVFADLPLSNNAWEMSFYRFISDFFPDCTRSHKSHHCPVDSFRGFRFNFSLKRVNLSLEFAPRPTYDLIPIHFPDNSEYYELLRFKTLIDLREAVNEVLARLIQATCEVQVEMSGRTVAGKEGCLEQMKEELAQVTEELSLEVVDLGKLEQTQLFRNYLLVEMYRRRVFFLVCKGKSVIENSLNSLKATRPASRRTLESPRIPPSPESQDTPRDNAASKTRISLQMPLIHPVAATNQLDPLLESGSFGYLQRGSLTLPLGKSDMCVPVEEEDSLSIVAYALNSVDFYENVGRFMSDAIKEGDRSAINEFIHCELLLKTTTDFHTSFSTYSDTDFQAAENKAEMQRLYGPQVQYDVTAYFPRQFQALRLYTETPESFLLSISKATKNHYRYGTSGASFSYTHDSKYVLKSTKEREVEMFLLLAPNYFQHVFKSFYCGMPSRLAKVYGAYRVSVKNLLTGNRRVEWLLLAENLRITMPRIFKVFDLKGTLNPRRFVRLGDKRTKMDRNFLEEMEGFPLFLTAAAKRELDAALWNDTLLLSLQNVVDYSLLVLVNDEKRELALGVIDYMQQYTFEKALENRYRRVTTTMPPTITNPEEYKKRFRTMVMQEYFLAIAD